MIVDVTCYVTCCPLDSRVLGILVNPFLLGGLFMKDDDRTENLAYINRILVLDHAYWMLSIKLKNNISAETTLPIYFNEYVIISRLQSQLYSAVPIAVHHICNKTRESV